MVEAYMQPREYMTRYDGLASEDSLFEIPLRKEYFSRVIGKGRKVLDVGCLGGRLSRFIMEQGNEVIGVELNPRAAEIAKARGVHVKIANLDEGLPFNDESFEIVSAGSVLEYLYDTKLFFDESHRVLKKDGILVFSVPNLNSLQNRFRVLTGEYLSDFGAYPEDHHGDQVRVFNMKKLEELCHQSKFKVMEVQGILDLETHGKWIDFSLGLMGKAFPGFSKVLMGIAQKAA